MHFPCSSITQNMRIAKQIFLSLSAPSSDPHCQTVLSPPRYWNFNGRLCKSMKNLDIRATGARSLKIDTLYDSDIFGIYSSATLRDSSYVVFIRNTSFLCRLWGKTIHVCFKHSLFIHTFCASHITRVDKETVWVYGTEGDFRIRLRMQINKWITDAWLMYVDPQMYLVGVNRCSLLPFTA